MNREIKFRAWNKDSKSMTYDLTLSLIAKEEALMLAKKTSEYQFMQYTGLKDRNGKSIYEGDRLSPLGAEIVWDNKLSCWGFRHKGDETITPIFHDNSGIEHFEVIGNIFEDKKLLEQ